MTRVFVVDDHAMVRAGVRAELGDDVTFVGEGADVASAVEGIRATRPDVVLLDVHLPGGGGRTVLETLRSELPDVRWLALSVSDAAEDVIAVIRAGARGYSYREVAAELFISVRTVETHVSSVLRKLQLSSRHELTRWAADRRLL